MKKILLALVNLLLILFINKSVWASGNVSATMNVSATVVETMELSVTPLAFGNWDGTQPANAIGNISLEAVDGRIYSVTLDGGAYSSNGSRHIANEAGVTLTYELRKADGSLWGDAGYGNTYSNGSPLTYTGSGALQTHVVYGTIPAEQALSTGTYSDLITVTVIY